MKIHIIAIGGAVMHQLAIALQQAGHIVSGSDDEIDKNNELDYPCLLYTSRCV